MGSQFQKGFGLRPNRNESSDIAEGFPMHWDRARTSAAAFLQMDRATGLSGERRSVVLDSIRDILNQNIW